MIDMRFLAQVVDDDPAIVRFLRRNLELKGFQVVVSSDGETALDQFEDESPDLVILDIGIPRLNGMEVCRYLRATSDVPIIIVTSRCQEEEVIEGLEAGADDYLSKPFSGRVLIARVASILRRRRPPVTTSVKRLEFDDLVIDLAARKITRSGKAIHITPTEYNLLALLVRQRGKVLTSAQILTEVWGPEYAAEFQILRTHIGRLRKKIETNTAEPSFILTETGVGYQFDCRK